MVFGHDHTFSADGATMSWQCRRGCGAGGSKTYPSPLDAARYARAFEHLCANDGGRRAPTDRLAPVAVVETLPGPEEGEPESDGQDGEDERSNTASA